MFTVSVMILFVSSVSGLEAGGADSQEEIRGLLSVKRICVESFVGDESLSAAVRELAIAGLFSAKRFVVTEKCETADAVLRGAILERKEQKVRAEGEAADFGVAAGGASASKSAAAAAIGAAVGGSGESLYSAETRTLASIIVRIVDREGTTIWSYSQDSPGGKTKGAIPDAMERAIKQLLRDIERAQGKP